MKFEIPEHLVKPLKQFEATRKFLLAVSSNPQIVALSAVMKNAEVKKMAKQIADRPTLRELLFPSS